MLQVGCVARVSRERRLRPKDSSPFLLDELEYLTTTTHAYLVPEVAVYRRLFLYQAATGQRGGNTRPVVRRHSTTNRTMAILPAARGRPRTHSHPRQLHANEQSAHDTTAARRRLRRRRPLR